MMVISSVVKKTITPFDGTNFIDNNVNNDVNRYINLVVFSGDNGKLNVYNIYKSNPGKLDSDLILCEKKLKGLSSAQTYYDMLGRKITELDHLLMKKKRDLVLTKQAQLANFLGKKSLSLEINKKLELSNHHSSFNKSDQ